MDKELLAIPTADIIKILPDFVEGYEKDSDLHNEWLIDEVDRFKQVYKNSLDNGKYIITVKELKKFTSKSFEYLINKESFELARTGKIEMGVDETGEIRFWNLNTPKKSAKKTRKA